MSQVADCEVRGYSNGDNRWSVLITAEDGNKMVTHDSDVLNGETTCVLKTGIDVPEKSC